MCRSSHQEPFHIKAQASKEEGSTQVSHPPPPPPPNRIGSMLSKFRALTQCPQHTVLQADSNVCQTVSPVSRS